MPSSDIKASREFLTSSGFSAPEQRKIKKLIQNINDIRDKITSTHSKNIKFQSEIKDNCIGLTDISNRDQILKELIKVLSKGRIRRRTIENINIRTRNLMNAQTNLNSAVAINNRGNNQE